jgi:TRAP-type C4-dicarboxylate transport system substrate-binding protein
MKKTLLLTFSIITVFAFISTPAVWAKSMKTKVLRLAVPWPPMDPVTVQVESFAEKFNQRAGGSYVIEVHPNESLVKIGESMDALRTGAVEMAGWPIGMFASMDRRFAAAELPFLANNAEADAALQVDLMPLYSEFMEKKFNSKAIFSFTCLALDVISTKPIKTAADWEGLLAQSVSPQSAKFIEYMGGASVAMPFAEGYQALQKGVVNASMQSSPMIIMFKLNEVAQYATRGYLIPAGMIIAINMDVYRKMPRDIQEIIVNIGKQQQIESNNFFINIAEENTVTLRKMGIDVYHLPKEERDRWAEMVKSYCDKLYEDMGPEFAAAVKKAAKAANTKYAYK